MLPKRVVSLLPAGRTTRYPAIIETPVSVSCEYYIRDIASLTSLTSLMTDRICNKCTMMEAVMLEGRPSKRSL